MKIELKEITIAELSNGYQDNNKKKCCYFRLIIPTSTN